MRHHGGSSGRGRDGRAVFAEEADFFSIGTNDLTQYTLAMDRGHPKLAPKVDALESGVLRLIAQTIEGAHASTAGSGYAAASPAIRRPCPSLSDSVWTSSA